MITRYRWTSRPRALPVSRLPRRCMVRVDTQVCMCRVPRTTVIEWDTNNTSGRLSALRRVVSLLQ